MLFPIISIKISKKYSYILISGMIMTMLIILNINSSKKLLLKLYMMGRGFGNVL
jgi:hypothetical protein